MENNEKEKIVYTRSDIMKRIARTEFIRYSFIRKVLDTLEEQMVELLSSADADKDVTIRLFEGISIDSTFLDEKEKRNNLTGETIMTKKKIKPKANVTRKYGEKLTAKSDACK